jgi:hypothetical protein
MRRLSATLAWLLLATLAVPKEPAKPAALPTPLFSRQTVFSIPYQIDPPAPGARRPVEVQLHVSENRGPWHLYAKVPPSQNHFSFRAAGDGDYWFMVRTRDDQGQLQPPGAPAPELWVIVDTEPPVLELVVERGAAGELRARWRASDNHLRAESMKLEYQVAGSAAWQTVAIDRPRSATRDTTLSGQATWMAGSNKDAMAVRAEIVDYAGNIVRTQQQIAGDHEAPRDRTANRRDANPRDRQTIVAPEPPWHEPAPNRDRAAGTRANRDRVGNTPANSDRVRSARGGRWQAEARDEGPLVGGAPPEMGERFPGRGVDRDSLSRPVIDAPTPDDRAASRPATRAQSTSAQPVVPFNNSTKGFDAQPGNDRANPRGAINRGAGAPPSEEILPPPVISSPLPIRDKFARDTARGPIESEDASAPDTPGETRRNSSTRRRVVPDEGGPWLTAADTPAQLVVNKPVKTEVPGTAQRLLVGEPIEGGKLDDEARSIAGTLLPPGVRPRMVNSPRFELEYEFESVGPAGIGKVELWGTRDGGRSWTSYGIDPDNRSPMSVTVAGEGLYGFRIVVESGTGLRGAPPQSGDEPEIWVGVDTIKPTARLTTADLSGGELTIHWEAADSLLAARPIALAYSQTPGGPWTTIAAGLANSGAFAWRLDNRVPDRVYLRLEARDEAGNVQLFEAADPVSLDPVRPKGRIRGVRPVDDAPSARGPQWYYNLR